MFKTVISRYTNVKAGKFTASIEEQQSSDYNEDDYESLNDVETVLDAIGIKIRKNAQEFRDFEDVLEEIASKWNSFDQTTQNAIGTAMFGTRQREIGLTVLENWSQVGKYEDIAANAYGTAEKKMEAFTDSVEAAKNKVTVAVEEWAIALNGGDTIKNFYNVIAFLIRNLNTLGIGVLGLALILNRNNLSIGAGKFANSVLGQISSFGGFTKNLLNGNLAGALSNGESGSPEMVVNNPNGLGLNGWQVDYLNGVQQEYAKALSGYTTTLNESQKQQMVALQNNLLADSAVKANTFATTLKQNSTIESMTTDQLHLVAEKMLIIAKDKEEEELWKNIAKLEQGQLTTEQLNQAQKAYAEKLQSGALQQAAENADEFHGQGRYEVKDKAKQSQSLGIASMGFSVAGTILGSSIGGQFGETGTIIGSLIGSTAGPALGKIMIEKASAYLASGSATGALASLAGFVTNPIGAAILAVFAVGAALGISKLINSSKKKLEELAQDFTDESNKYTEYKSALVTADKYDELAKGVDQLGRNLTLTDDEYKQFLDYSNQLAETFPEMVQYTDEAGNKLLGYGGKVGQVSSAIEQLVEQQKRATNQALLQKDLFKQSYGEAYDEYSTASKEKKQKQSQLEKLGNYKRVGNEIVFNGENAERNRAEFINLFNKNQSEVKASTLTGPDIGYKVVFNTTDFNKIDDALKEVNTQLNSDIQDLDNTMSNARQGLSDQINAILDEMKHDAKYKTLFAGMTDEMKQIVQLTASNVPFVEGESDEDFMARLEDTIAQIAQFVNDNPVYLDFMLAPDAGMSAQEYEQTRQDMLKALMQVFGVDNIEDLSDGQIKVLATFGFKLDDKGNLIDENDVLAQFKNEGLDKYLGFDLSNSKYKYSVDEIKQITQMLQQNPSYYKTEDDLFDKVISSKYKEMSTTEIAKEYKNYKSFEDSLTDEEKKRYEVIKKTMDLWAERLGAVKGKYDQIADKAEALGDLGMFGESTKTPNEVIDQTEQYKKWYSYMKNDYKGTWDAETLANMAEDSNLVPLLGDPKKLTAKLKEYVDNADLLYDKAMVKILGSSEEGWKYLLSINSEAVNKFKENYNIDLSNFKTMEEAETKINAIANSQMQQSTISWVAQMFSLYQDDLANFSDVTSKKVAMLGIVYGQLNGLNNITGQVRVGEEINDLAEKKFDEKQAEYEKKTGEKATLSQQLQWSKQSQNEAIDETTKKYQKQWTDQYVADLMEDYNAAMSSGMKTNFKDASSSSGSNKDATKDRWEALKKYYESIDKEWEAMLAFDENRDTEYFDKKRAAGLAEMAEINGLLDKQNELLKAGKLTSDDIAELEERRITLQKELNNLDDEYWEDRISILDTLDATLESQILAQEELLKTSDTEEERLERQQKLNDLIKQEYELRMDINDWEEKNAERAQKYLSGNAYSNAGQYDVFTNLRRQNIKASQQEAWNNYTSIVKQAEANLALENKNGGKNWTPQEIYNKARETQDARDALDKYFELVEQENDLINEAFEAKVDELDTRISELEKTKPEEWGHLADIQPYYNNTISLIQAKINQIEEALSNTQGMTDEQIQAWVDKYNEAIQALHDAQKSALEDITNYQSNQFNALTDWIEEYKQTISDIKDSTDDYYDDLIAKLDDYNQDLTRTNTLLEKQKALQDSLNSKQRVYREGIGWVKDICTPMMDYIG